MVLLIAIPTVPVSAGSVSNNTLNSNILIRLNQFYVVFTSPIAPYMDKNNRIMVPLRSLSNLLSADVTYNPESKTAVISRKNLLNATEKFYTIKMAVSEKRVEINGVRSEMDTTPTLYKGSMFVPLCIITTAFHINTEWDQINSIMKLNVDPAYLPSEVVSDELHFLSDKMNEDLRPIKSSAITNTNPYGTHLTNVRLTAVNEGTSAVLSNKLYFLFYIKEDSHFHQVEVVNPSLIQPGGTLTLETGDAILSDSLQYVLVGVYNY
ncbi:copper amine oxidase N-terminal domain-containing protein [Paenibacillus sp. GCM10012306]|uniref:copper amine oxidase N-terminal domain-containing protein n=1 Tax=Paenibacillus sp. GCM10012306 TaxID=3317342 RepID=UPI0036D34031